MVVETRQTTAIVAIIELAAAATSLRNSFAYDDIAIIATNAQVHDLSSWWKLFALPYWPPPYGGSWFRPIAVLGYSLQWAIGNGSPLTFHIVSIALYSALAVAV